MLARYTRPQMGAIWSLENQYRLWLRIEVLAAEAMAELGLVPAEALAQIKARADFTLEGIARREAVTRHDLIAFLEEVQAHVGEAGRYLHLGLTSSDVKDTALALQMVQGLDLLIADADRCLAALKARALAERETVMVGRTHGIHAEPVTLGLTLALWAFEMDRNRQRLHRARRTVAVGKLSGPVGTYASVDPFVETYVCRKLGLRPAPLSSQIVQRDRHAELLWACAITAASVEKMATQVRLWSRTDQGEVEEPFQAGQKGSSAMPHKRNPILSERLTGLARLFRGWLVAGLENVALWDQRDLTHSSVERVILPDATITLDYMLDRLAGLIEGLVVHPERMARNLARTEGLIHSQRVLLALVERGLDRTTAYERVQAAAMAAWEGQGRFADLLTADPVVARYLTRREIEGLLDVRAALRHLDRLFARLEAIPTPLQMSTDC
ncbi:MAG: adenylosuccinate lyase [Chloroflexi bacterium]|nr:MAG: adenylosuccinate lyase [Chloroflexota bacterium]